jgi:type IV secretory pathway ATPase VirB11/archaellum biosynthesis ATPase
MNERSVVIIGLPESGKTTFLAALWHLITERDVETMVASLGW